VTLLSTCLTPNACTSLSNSAGAEVPFTVSSGTITVTTASTPEPSTLLLSLLAIPVFAWRSKKCVRRA
jgi:hypothetical protein